MLTLALALLALGLPSSTQDSDRLFPLPSEDLVVDVGEEGDTMSMEDMVLEYGRLTNQYILFDDETRGYLASQGVGLRRSLVIPKADLQAIFEQCLDSNDYVLLVLRQEQPRLLGIVSLQTGSRNTVRQRALIVSEKELERWSDHRAVLISTVIHLPHTDVRQLANSTRTLIIDANIQQMLAAGNTNSMILTGFASNVAALARMLRNVDAAAATEVVESTFERLPLNHAQASVAAAIVQELMDASNPQRHSAPGSAAVVFPTRLMAHVVADDRTNALLVLALPTEMRRIHQLVELVDVEQK